MDRRLPLVLKTNAIVSAATGVLMAVAASPLASLMNTSASVLRVLGLALLPFAAFVLVVARDPVRSRVALVSACDFAWVAGTVAVAFLTPMSTIGRVLTVACAVVVELFGTLQLLGSRDPRATLAPG